MNIRKLKKKEIADLNYEQLLNLGENYPIGTYKYIDIFFNKVSRYNIRYKYLKMLRMSNDIMDYIESDMISVNISKEEYIKIVDLIDSNGVTI